MGDNKGESKFLNLDNVPDMVRLLMNAGDTVNTGMTITEGILTCDHELVGEAMYRAMRTVQYHENTNRPNHRKEIAHFCHWLMRLKPLTAIRYSDLKVAQRARLELGDIKEITNPPKKETEARRRVNEIATVHLACLLLHRMEKTIIQIRLEKNEIDQAKADRLTSWLEDRHQQLLTYATTLAYSFREHTYSARSTAMLFELAFASELDSELNGYG